MEVFQHSRLTFRRGRLFQRRAEAQGGWVVMDPHEGVAAHL